MVVIKFFLKNTLQVAIMAFLKPCEDNGRISKEPKHPDQFEALHPYLASVNKASVSQIW